MKKNNNWLYLIPASLLVVSLIASTIIFRQNKPVVSQEPDDSEKIVTDENLLKIDNSMPKTEACPLNGELYTKVEQEAWSKRRPLAVMIENTPDARPQSGLSNADIVFEAVAEGGITRFMPIFYCDAQKEDLTLAPIRSARTYYINLASGFNRPMYVHVGGANLEGPTNALGQLADYGWNTENDINQFSVGYPTFVRDYNRIPGKEVATEHTMTTTTEKLWTIASKRSWTNMSPEQTVGKKKIAGSDWQDGYKGWTFVKGVSAADTQNISYNFWTGQPTYDVSWTYDKASNTYSRSNGGDKQTDLNNGQPLAFSDVVVIFAKETGPINEAKHMMYDVIGKGDGILFANGVAKDLKWEKKTRESEMIFTDKSGKDLELTQGKVWVSVLPDGNKVTY